MVIITRSAYQFDVGPYYLLQWPFNRVLGVQEPASTLFSLLNALTVIHGYTRFKMYAPSEYPYHTIVSVQFWVSIDHSVARGGNVNDTSAREGGFRHTAVVAVCWRSILFIIVVVVTR